METLTETIGIIAEIELSYKNPVAPEDRATITQSSDAYKLLMNHWDTGKIELQEQFKVILLNQAKQVLGIIDLSMGGTTATVIDRRLMFAAALKAAATEIILAHNHPSGNLKPSTNDIRSTKLVCESGIILDILVLDHLVVSPRGYYSFADEGLI